MCPAARQHAQSGACNTAVLCDMTYRRLTSPRSFPAAFGLILIGLIVYTVLIPLTRLFIWDEFIFAGLLALVIGLVCVEVADRRASRARLRADLELILMQELSGKFTYLVMPFKLEDAIVARTALAAADADSVIGGLTTTLDHIVRESTQVQSIAFPFPVVGEDSKAVLINAIRSASGISVGQAEQALAAISEVIRAEIALTVGNERKALVVFPIGSYEALGSDQPIFSPHSASLQRYFPRLHSWLGSSVSSHTPGK